MTGLQLPPASDRQGVPGHDKAIERANGDELLRLRLAGLTYAQIAAQVGYRDASGARTALLRALDRHEAENAVQLRALENGRIDAVVRTATAIMIDTTADRGERLRAGDVILRASARRSRLNGLDAPVQVALSAGVEAELVDALAEVEDVLRLVQGTDGTYTAPSETGDDDA